MALEFTCEKCERTLRVPDGSSGKRSQCPACQHEQEIPFVVNLSDPSANEGELHDGGQGGRVAGQLSIPCPRCQHHLRCDPKLVGTRGQCKKCQHIFTITNNPAPLASVGDTGLVFHCPDCRQLFEGREEMRGRKGKCHMCGSVFTIELERSSRAQPAPMSLPKANSAPKAPPKPSVPIRFECSSCHGIMEVPGSTAGMETACPYCEAEQTIPAKSTVSRSRPAAVSPSQPALPPVPAAANPFSDPLIDSISAANPYAVSDSAGAWTPAAMSSGTSSRRGVSVNNAFSLAFESMLPSIVALSIHMIIAVIFGVVMRIAMRLTAESIRPLDFGIEVKMSLLFAAIGVFVMISAFFGAWFTGAIANTALRAVRKKKFDMGEAFAPGGGMGPAISIAMIQLLISLLMFLPSLAEYMSPGSIKSMHSVVLVYLLALLVLNIGFVTLSSFAIFAGIDGEESMAAIGRSGSIYFNHLGTMLIVKILAWILAIILAIPTLGLGVLLVIYVNAALYHLATRD